MPFPRASGILVHPSSFPSAYGIGDLGPSAYRFVDFLADSGQKFWQILPLGPTGYGNSPYMCYSAIAGNPILISPEELKYKDLVNDEDLGNLPEFSSQTVDFDTVIAWKTDLLWKSYKNFLEQPQEDFLDFCDRKSDWLEDYALFMAIKGANRGESWNNWEPAIANRDPEALKACKNVLKNEINFQKYLQFEFFRQWGYLKKYANEKGIKIIGDIPIYVSHDSADVWANPKLFCLHPKTGEATLKAGVPPDYFSETGQLWGNPIYNWYQLRKQNYKWWIKRFHGMLDVVDWIRIDHFRGFESYWAVWYGEKTAMKGRWIKGPRAAFFETLKQELGTLPIIAEDLGDITPEVTELLDKFEFPGMKILQFAFGAGSGNPYLPHAYGRNCLVYTGTHDNDTTVGWFNQLSEEQKEDVRAYIGRVDDGEIHWDMIREILKSVADWAIIPMQDLLGLDSEHRMNTPGKGEGNWAWRYGWDDLNSGLSDRLRHLTETYGRIPGE